MKNKKYFAGLITGILCTAIVFGASFAVFDKTNIFGVKSEVKYSTEKENATDDAAAKEAKEKELFLSKIDYIKKLVNAYYLGDVSEQEYETGMLRGVMDALDDQYSCYYTKEEYDNLMESSSGQYYGIGAYVSQDIKTGIITIVKPFVDGPAYKAGMLPGDKLIKVNDMEVTGVDLTKVVSYLKGASGTEVKVTVAREGESKPIEMGVIRANVDVPTIESTMLEKDNIGYILVSEFNENTVIQFKDAIDKLEKDGMEGLIIDLRNNPGGLYNSAVDMLDYLLPKGLLVYQEDKTGKRLTESYATNKHNFELPLCLIVNGNSASASEIFAGAVQDYGAGTLVGTQTFGKGIVQSVIPLKDGSAVKMTISKYFTPKGRNIHKLGITPDIEEPLNEELAKKLVITFDEDNQLQKAIEVIKDKVKAGTK